MNQSLEVKDTFLRKFYTTNLPYISYPVNIGEQVKVIGDVHVGKHSLPNFLVVIDVINSSKFREVQLGFKKEDIESVAKTKKLIFFEQLPIIFNDMWKEGIEFVRWDPRQSDLTFSRMVLRIDGNHIIASDVNLQSEGERFYNGSFESLNCRMIDSSNYIESEKSFFRPNY